MDNIANKTCVYAGCKMTWRANRDLHFFRFPVRDQERCAIWVEHSGNSRLRDFDLETLRNKTLCQLHFDDESFTNEYKKRLIFSAVPRHYEDDYQDEPPSETVTSESSNIPIIFEFVSVDSEVDLPSSSPKRKSSTSSEDMSLNKEESKKSYGRKKKFKSCF